MKDNNLENMQKTWSTPKPFVIHNLPKEYVGKFVTNERISEYQSKGWVILTKDMSIAKDVSIGYNDADTTDNRFTYMNHTVMIATKEMIEDRTKQIHKASMLPLTGGVSSQTDEVVKETGLKGMTAEDAVFKPQVDPKKLEKKESE